MCVCVKEGMIVCVCVCVCVCVHNYICNYECAYALDTYALLLVRLYECSSTSGRTF